MSITKKITTGTAVAATAALGLGMAITPATAKAGNEPLSAVLLADGDEFDSNGKDYDIVTQAALAVITDDPKSPVALLTDGTKRATVFAPQDRAFIKLVKDLGVAVDSEQAAFEAIAGTLSLDQIENILLYHVVAGKTITGKQASKANGATLKTAQGGKLTIKVKKGKIRVVDQNKDFPTARVVQANINKGNKQIAHGINAVLVPKAGLTG
jgi:uncharacterized surface protein with fasciclin (FAS1) repeats